MFIKLFETDFQKIIDKTYYGCTFKFSSRTLIQVDGCSTGGALYVTFSDIYMVKTENDVVIPCNSIFYCRFVDDIYSRQKLGDNVLFD